MQAFALTVFKAFLLASHTAVTRYQTATPAKYVYRQAQKRLIFNRSVYILHINPANLIID
ncbi:hypothetical protein [Corynebacterium durum]|uniref:hypothetical protein n=1 Tax=Corynebacterium durum TaxID=61592 RepID=UPI0028F09B5E|nr:hypothetical protein [Corynebacterium durum]